MTSPHELYEQAGGDPAKYRALMIEHGHLIPRDRSGRCPTCEVSKQNVLEQHEDIRLKLVAMTAARDHCKQQTADVEAARQRLGQGFNALLEHIHSNEHTGPRMGCVKCRDLEASALSRPEPR